MNFKATILACMTFLAGIAIIITYASQQDRYAIFSQDKAIFVFDRKNATLNFCNDHACQLITPYAGENGAMPAQMAIMNGQPVTQAMMQQSGIMQMSQVAQPFMPQMTPQSSLQGTASPMMQPQQVVLMANSQASKAPVPSGPAPVAPAPVPSAVAAPAPVPAPAAAAAAAPAAADPAPAADAPAPDAPPADAAPDAAAPDAAAPAAEEAPAEEAPAA